VAHRAAARTTSTKKANKSRRSPEEGFEFLAAMRDDLDQRICGYLRGRASIVAQVHSQNAVTRWDF